MKNFFKKQPVTIKAAIISGFFALIATIITITVPRFSEEFPAHTDSDVKLVDASFIETENFPILDIKIRNTGGNIAFLKKAIFSIKEIYVLKRPFWPAAQPATWEYSILLPIRGAPYSIEKNISQSIPPNSVDRFTFVLGNDAPPDVKDYVYLLDVQFIYDEDNKIINTGNLLFISKSPAIFLGLSQTRKLKQETYEYNRATAKIIDKIKGKKSEQLEKILKNLL